MVEGKDYDFVHAKDVFDDNNSGFIYGIYWLDEFQNVLDCTWYKTEKDRLNDLNAVGKQLKGEQNNVYKLQESKRISQGKW